MIYVDKLRDWGWKLGPSCHLFSIAEPSDNIELHEFAARLGLKRSWFQESSSGPHYDLVASKRVRAVQLGAVEVTDRQMVAILKVWRSKAVSMVKKAATEEEASRIRAKLYS